jgi:uncharacterized membrane protein
MAFVMVAVLIITTVSMGLMAGLFYAYSISGMPGLHATDDRTFVGAMQSINRAILNRLFLLPFTGTVLLGLLSVILTAIEGRLLVLIPTILALLFYLAMFFITGRINVPLNNQLEAAGPVDKITDVAAVRARFEERWVKWNNVRSFITLGAFISMCLAVAAL